VVWGADTYIRGTRKVLVHIVTQCSVTQRDKCLYLLYLDRRFLVNLQFLIVVE
jgi:hypothetical protein